VPKDKQTPTYVVNIRTAMAGSPCTGRLSGIASEVDVMHFEVQMIVSAAEVMRFIARELSVHSYVNVMAQYRPENKADRHPELSRRITSHEYGEALRLALEQGLYRLAR